MNFNEYEGMTYPIRHEEWTRFDTEAEDPDHSGASVDEQHSGDNGGFVATFAKYSTAKAQQLGVPVPDPGLVMGYYTGRELPGYDHLASEYCVVDRWFSSVPGATWPNRLYAAAGRAQGSRNDISPPIYALPAFPRYLEERGGSSFAGTPLTPGRCARSTRSTGSLATSTSPISTSAR